MKDRMIEHAFYLYEQQGDKCIHEINRIQRQAEYLTDINQKRLIDKITAKLENKISISPEEILIERERKGKVLHFIQWIKKLVINELGIDDWKLWRDKNLYGENASTLSKRYKLDKKDVYKNNKKTYRLIRNAIPLYSKEFGDIKEYLQN
ncbi:hypothetical protein HMPREF0872_03905 [Veillonella montpellierensis DNF00314]|uniref:Uncharacterized protein n=1 Tax=Veillonella montpellierensis DNF00314 TaxID=1401067 RepID=A0A096AL42_9FIRM|nr:hypothetical protein [Veillonella montpellierensis]KGF47550.1 hypothetical protein HMPREF0872_03905 [Veillonella montpellierensis DNF00314]